MKLTIISKPGSKRTYIKKIDETHYIVAVGARARDGAANKAIVKAVANYFDTAPSHCSIISGFTSKLKIIEFS